MPIYEFQCAACGKRTEELMRLSDPDPIECPHCGVAQLKRLVSAPSFRLSGSGWYETDFKKDGDKKRNLSGDSGNSETSTQSTSDKPAGAETSPTNAAASTPTTSIAPSDTKSAS